MTTAQNADLIVYCRAAFEWAVIGSSRAASYTDLIFG